MNNVFSDTVRVLCTHLEIHVMGTSETSQYCIMNASLKRLILLPFCKSTFSLELLNCRVISETVDQFSKVQNLTAVCL